VAVLVEGDKAREVTLKPKAARCPRIGEKVLQTGLFWGFKGLQAGSLNARTTDR
jgi:hypothetical protein